MKKIIILSITTLFAFIAKSQNTCINAKYLYNTLVDTIPPPGTMSPAGPDYGCLTITGRQLWYYIPVCKSFQLTSLELNYGSSNDTVGLIFYGPFSQKVTDCADLTAAKIIGCAENVLTNNFTSLMLNTTLLEGSYYYALATFSDGITSTLGVGLTGNNYQTCFECNNQVSVMNQNNMCLLTVDTAINKCVLTWEEFPSQNLLGYNIYRENTFGLYDSLTTIPIGSMSTYTDMTSSPAQHNERYKMIGVDSCGQSYDLISIPQWTSIHLISFAGGNNQASLIWNNVFVNNNFIAQYYIHRNNNGTGWQVIDSVGVSISPITYTDIFAPAGTNQYTVELRKLVPCIPMKTTSSNPYQSVFSNTSLAVVTGIENISLNDEIKIYPNPVKDFLCIHSNFTNAKEMEVILFNPYGQKLKTLYTGEFPAGKNEMKFSLKEFPAGIYFLKMNADGKEVTGKIVKY